MGSAVLNLLALLRVFSVFLAYMFIPVEGAVVALTKENLDSVLAGSEVVFVNFYADWCRFSQMLTPVFEEASEKIKDVPKEKVTWASVDCDRQSDVAQKYHISKYPTLKIFRNGQVAKREYRGQRSVEALAAHVNSQLESAAQELASIEDMNAKVVADKRTLLGFFTANQGHAYDNFRKISSNLREDCKFFVGFGAPFQSLLANGNVVKFRDVKGNPNNDAVFTGDMNNFDYMSAWITDKCIPLVREITFENAEELTEEGLPFLILFRKNEDEQALETFKQEVTRQLGDLKSTVNALYADGRKFAHPLHHLGKAEADLPVIAIDSFRHMYLFPKYEELTEGDKLRQFVLDLHSGKLHREFHHGPDPSEAPPPGTAPDGNRPPDQERVHIPASGKLGPPGGHPQQTDPPESVFQKLKPSPNRYTILHDEF